MGVLHDAARSDDGKVAEILARGGADVNGRDRHSRTPLHLAAWAGQTRAVEALLAAGADANAAATDDTNALHFASQKGHTEVVKLLLDKGVNLKSKTRKGMNALHFAAQNGHTELVALLLQKKASPTAQNKKGQTAIDLAKSEELKKLLTNAAEAHSAAQPSVGPQPRAGDAEAVSNAAAASPSELGNEANDTKTAVRHKRQHLRNAAAGGKHTEDAEGTLPSAGPTLQSAVAAQPAVAPAGPEERIATVEPVAKKQKVTASLLSHLGDEEED